MSDALFDIVFSGRIVDGFDESIVKEKVAQLFKLDTSKVDELFQSAPVVLKPKVDKAAAKKYDELLSRIGMIVELRECQSEAVQESASPPAPEFTLASQPCDILRSDERISTPEFVLPDFLSQWTLSPEGAYLLEDKERSHIEPLTIDNRYQ